MTVVEHLEEFCGEIVGGRSTDPDGKNLPFQVIRLAGGPITGSVTFSTLGLSNIQLRSATSSKMIRHELIMLARPEDVPQNLPALLQQVGQEAIARGFAYLRGDVVGPRGSLFSESNLKALYVAAPVYFPQEFAGTTTEMLGPVVFAWLVPITGPEASYVGKQGWPTFEDMLVRENPDLLDFHRSSLV